MNEILSHLFRRKLRTLLTLFAIGVGIFALTVVGSLSEFMNEMITRSEQDAVNRIYVWPENWGENPFNEGTLRELGKLIPRRSRILERVDDLCAYFNSFRKTRLRGMPEESGVDEPEKREPGGGLAAP